MRLFLVVLGLVAIMLTPILIFGDEIDDAFAGEEGLRRLQEYGSWAWLVGMALIVGDLILPVPSTAVIAGLGMLYGPWLGGLLGGLGSILAGLVAYGGCRLLGKRFLDFLVGETNLEKLGRFFQKYGLWAIALSRWMPILPEALSCLAGMARMPFGPFLAALSTGSLAMGMVFGFLGTAYLDRPVIGLVVSALIPVVVWPFIHFSLRRNKSKSERLIDPKEVQALLDSLSQRAKEVHALLGSLSKPAEGLRSNSAATSEQRALLAVILAALPGLRSYPALTLEQRFEIDSLTKQAEELRTRLQYPSA